MIVDKFTKFILSIIAIFLCLNALNPWLNPPLVNAEPSQISQLNDIDRLALFDLIEFVGKWAKFEVEVHQRKQYAMPQPETTNHEKTLEDTLIRISEDLKTLADVERTRFESQLHRGDYN